MEPTTAAALDALPADLTTATPPQIDNVLHLLHRDAARADSHTAYRVDELHRAIGDTQERRPGHGGRRYTTWVLTLEQAEAQAREIIANEFLPDWDRNGVRTALTKLEKIRADRDEIRQAAAPLNEQWQTRGWFRFFSVLNTGGHIHRSMSCSTCRPSTRYGWHPELSGLTEAHAVMQLGPTLCTICFPSAPVEWTAGKAKPVVCEGSRKPPAPRTISNTYSRYGVCTVCHTKQSVTSLGLIRAHKPAKEGT